EFLMWQVSLLARELRKTISPEGPNGLLFLSTARSVYPQALTNQRHEKCRHPNKHHGQSDNARRSVPMFDGFHHKSEAQERTNHYCCRSDSRPNPSALGSEYPPSDQNHRRREQRSNQEQRERHRGSDPNKRPDGSYTNRTYWK